MGDAFWSRGRDHGRRPALLLPDGSALSHADLADRSRVFAARLGSKRRLVAIEMAPSEHAVAAYLGALLGGHAVVPLPVADDAQRRRVVERLSPEVVYRRTGGRWRLEEGGSQGGPLHPELAQVMTTSGSTGEGKFVRLSAAAVASNAQAIAAALGLGPDDRAALVLPLHYSYGLSVLTSHLAVGGSVDLGLGSVLDDGVLERMARSGCTNLSGVPYTFDLLERIGFRDRIPEGLRFMTAAGGRLQPERVRLYDAALRARGGRFFVMYGQTEATARIAVLPPEDAGRTPDRIGVAIPGGTIGLLDDAGRPVRVTGRIGELVYRGPNVMMGYAETREDLARGPEIEVLRTGDLADVDADGLYRIVGRKARFSKIAGVRVGHDALEAALARSGTVAAVTGDDAGLLVAYEGPEASEPVRRRTASAAGLPPSLVRVAAVRALPRLASGKVDLGAVKALFADARPSASVAIAATYREIFWPHPVRDTDTFVSLSGDSLRFVELSCALERRLGRIPDRWETMTVAELARLEPQRRSRTASVRTDLVIRAFAILMVVLQHATLWPVPGGAAAMMVLIGFGLARFQAGALAAGDFSRVLRPLASVLLPYYAIVAAYALAWGEMPWTSVVLVGNFGFADPVRHTMLPFLYWFVEAYTQILLVMVGLFAIPRVRAFAAARPFAFALAFLLGAHLLRGVGQAFVMDNGRHIFTLFWIFHLCAFGWCAAVADTPRRRAIVLALAAVAMPAAALAGGNWVGSWIKFGLQVPVIAALLYFPAVRLPSRLAFAVLVIAAASYHIYLFHRFVPELLLAPWEIAWPPAVFTGVSIVGGIALGVALFAAQRSAKSWLAGPRPLRAMLKPRSIAGFR